MLSVTDFEQPFFGLSQQGTDAKPKEVPLIVIGWEPRGKNVPPISVPQLQQLIFGPSNSITHWLQENSRGRYRIVPHPTHPIIGPFTSVNDWQFYWRKGSFAPPAPGDPHYYVDQQGSFGKQGQAYYLDDDGFISGFAHSYAEAIRLAAEQQDINFSIFDQNHNGDLAVDECLVLIVKANDYTDGYARPTTGSQVPQITALKVDNVSIQQVCELYASPPHEEDDLAVAVEEVIHLAVNLADQYPDNNLRHDNDPGRPGQLSLTDAGRRPVHTDPYHKLKWGWLNPQLANHSGKYTLRDAATTGDALILYSPYFGTNEFFILENRWRGSSYDRYCDNNWQEGLALWNCIQDPQLSGDWARRAIHLRRADPRLDANGGIQNHLTLFDGSDPARGYNLDDDSFPQNLRFRNGMPSRLRIRNISPAGPLMTVEVIVPPEIGVIMRTEGYIKMLRVHEHGTGYGPDAHRLNEDCIITLDTEPGAAFGINLSGASAPAGWKIFEQLRNSFNSHLPVKIEYQATSAIGGQVIRVFNTH